MNDDESFRLPDEAFVRVDWRTETGRSGGHLFVARFPVTVEEYQAFVDQGGYEKRQWWSERGWAWLTAKRDDSITRPQYWRRQLRQGRWPVTGVSFWEAEAYARFRDAALPTECEWYQFASNGLGSRYPWGDADEPTRERANLAFFGLYGRSRRVPVDDTKKSPSTAGVRDLIGNVAEWCLPGGRTTLRDDQLYGVLRGGASWHVPGSADTSFRDEVVLQVRDNQTGIRLVRRPPVHVELTENGWPIPARDLGRAIARPTKPFRQEGIPDISIKDWRLQVKGNVPHPKEFSLKELQVKLPTQNIPGLFVCVCRWAEVNRFAGVLLSDVLRECGLDTVELRRRKPLYLRQVSAPGKRGMVYETTVPLQEALDHRALLAYNIDGKALTPELGWPLRYIDFHQYGYKSVKCLSEIIIQDEHSRGWWENACHYDLDGTIRPGTVTVVGPRAYRLDITQPGKVDIDLHRSDVHHQGEIDNDPLLRFRKSEE